MIGDTNPPAFVGHGVVDTFLSRVTLRFQGVAKPGAARCRAVADAHVDWIGRVAEMVCAREITGLRRRRM